MCTSIPSVSTKFDSRKKRKFDDEMPWGTELNPGMFRNTGTLEAQRLVWLIHRSVRISDISEAQYIRPYLNNHL